MQKNVNYAFIDGQNLYQWLNWKLDYKKFRIYLKDKFGVDEAYYFLWFREKENNLYEKLQRLWFILIFNLKWEYLKSNKKWNVDTNLVFYAMKKYIEDDFDKIVLVSWDWDYKMMVDYFEEKQKLSKVISPNFWYASSLYKHKNNLDQKYFMHLDQVDVRKKIEYKKKSLRH